MAPLTVEAEAGRRPRRSSSASSVIWRRISAGTTTPSLLRAARARASASPGEQDVDLLRPAADAFRLTAERFRLLEVAVQIDERS